MLKSYTRGVMGLGLFAGLALIAVGCGPSGNTGGPARDSGKQAAQSGKSEEGHGWWCDEHGVPEEECSMCSAKLEKEARARGDWCEKHQRAMSQCFYCKPERREFYAAKYRAEKGKDPPPIPEFDDKTPEATGKKN